MQSLPKVQWHGLSFLVLHTMVIAMVHAGTRKNVPLEIYLIQKFFDHPFQHLVEALDELIFQSLPGKWRYPPP